jgi:hypothetical protein
MNLLLKLEMKYSSAEKLHLQTAFSATSATLSLS